jgi:hypothetical protein
VNGISIINLPHGDIVNLIKDSGYSVTLTIGMPLGMLEFIFLAAISVNTVPRSIHFVFVILDDTTENVSSLTSHRASTVYAYNV